MAGYDDTYQMIISTLMGRPVGTEIQPDSQQAYEINMLNYIRSLELIANGPLIGIAEANTQPIQPNDARACYIAGVAQDRTVTFQNFRNYLGQPIQITNGQMEACLVILIWDTQYWSATQVPTNIISAAEQANFYYSYNIRKTYPSVAAMNADKDNPIGTDGKYINIGDIVSVVNTNNPDENGFYSRIPDNWQFISGYSFQIASGIGNNLNEAISQNDFSVLSGLIEYSVFDNNSPYNRGKKVIYQGQLYEFVVDHVAGDWNTSEVLASSLHQDLMEGISEEMRIQMFDLNLIKANFQEIKPTWIKGEYYNPSGTIGTTTSWERAEIDVSSIVGSSVLISVANVTPSGSGGYCLFSNADGSQIQYFQAYAEDNYAIRQVPAWATKLLLSNRWQTLPNPHIYIGSAFIPAIINKMPTNDIVKTWIKGEYYDNSGNIGTQVNWERAEPIDVTELVGQTLYCKAFLNAGGFICVKDASGTVILTKQGEGEFSFVIPTGATQLLLCNRWASYENPSFRWTLIPEFLLLASKTSVDEITREVEKIELILPPIPDNTLTWEQGGINAAGDEQLPGDPNYPKRIRSIGFSSLNGSLNLNCASGYGYRIFEYSDSGIYLTYTNYDAGGSRTHVCGSNTAKVRFNLLKTGGEAITPIEASNAQFTCTGIDKVEKLALQSSVDEVYSGMPQNLSLTWIKGEYYNVSGNIDTQVNWERAEPIDVTNYVGKTISFHGVLQDAGYAVYKNNSGSVIGRFQTSGNPNGYYLSKIPTGATQLLLCNRWASYENPSLFIEGAGRIPLLAVAGQGGGGNSIRNNLSGKKVMFIGDSITAAGGYLNTFASLYSCTSVNLGVSGTCIANNTTNGLGSSRFVTRATVANLTDAAMIVVFGGTNDFSYDSKAIGDLFVLQDRTAQGNIGDKKIVAPTDTDAFGGALHDLINTIMTNAPTVPIVFMTPLNRGRYTANNPNSDESNKNGNYMRDFADAINEICTFYSIPVLDLNAMSNLDFLNPDIAAKYSSDNLHPNTAGHTLIGNILFRFVEQNVVIL